MGSLTALGVRRNEDGETVLSRVVSERRISPRALAEASGRSRTTVHHLLHGTYGTTTATAQAVTEAVSRLSSLTVGDLFDQTDHSHGSAEQATS